MDRRRFVSGSILSAAAMALGKQASVDAAQPARQNPSVPASLELPVIMDFTVVPSTLTARAWTDASFRTQLLADPNTILQATPMRELSWPAHIRFRLHEDTRELTHLTLPVYKPFFDDMREEELLARLKHETDCETALKFFLPVDVIWAAWFDPEFKTQLLTDATLALRARGYHPTRQIKVYANEINLYHLALKVAPVDVSQLDLAAARARYIDMMSVARSSQCCASGTCDGPVPT